MRTPLFLRWSLDCCCSLRQHRNWRDPEQTERQLRALSEYSRAQHEGRVLEGICVEAEIDTARVERRPVKGFQEDEVWRAYADREELSALCGSCAANAAAVEKPDALAGCFGMLPIDEDPDNLAARLSAAVESLLADEKAACLFAATNPRHFGLWIEPSPDRAQVEVLLRVLQTLERDGGTRLEAVQLLVAALEIARANEAPIRFSLYPAGRVVGDNWIVDGHCPRCKASRDLGPGNCLVCGFRGRATAPRRRHVRGGRPYWPIANFLGDEEAAAFLVRYREHRRQANGAITLPSFR